MWFMVKSLQRLIFRNGGSTSIVRTVIYQRDKFVQCYEASSFCYMYLASKVARCNILSNTKETNMHAIASQWLTDHSKYVLPPFQNKCLNFMLHTEQNEWICTLKYIYIHQRLEYVLVVRNLLKDIYISNNMIISLTKVVGTRSKRRE